MPCGGRPCYSAAGGGSSAASRDRAAAPIPVPTESAIPHGRPDTPTGRPLLAWGAAAALLLLLAVHAAASARHKTPTVDEFAHVPAGYMGLTTGRVDLYGKTPPLGRTLFSLPLLASRPTLPDPPPGSRMGGWYPWTYATGFFNVNVRERGVEFVDRVYRHARWVVIGFTLLLGLLVFAWARTLHGATGGLLALALFSLDPTVLAHGRLATVDMAAALFFFLAVWTFVRWLDRPGWVRLALAGLAAGAALATKFTAVLLAPIFLGLAVVQMVRAGAGRRREAARRLASGLAIIGLLTLLVVNLAYGFGESFRTWGSYQVRSQTLSRLHAGWLGWVPVPLPADFVRGLDAQQVDVEVGDFPNYFNGRWSRQGWWYYYPAAYALKTPLPLVLLLLAAAGLAAAGRLDLRGRRHLHTQAGLPPGAPFRTLSAWAVGLSVGVILFAACFLNRLDIGIRYILPVFPFLFVGMASLGRLLRRGEPVAAGLILAGLLTTAASTLSAFPHYLAYFNILAGGPAGGWQVLTNSNNDWGQDLKYLRRELQARGESSIYLAYFGHAEPGAYGLTYTVPLPGGSGEDALSPGRGRFPYTFAPGLYAISANLLVGLPYQVMDHGRWVPAGDTLAEPQQIFAYFRKRPPEAVIGGSILLYRVEGAGP